MKKTFLAALLLVAIPAYSMMSPLPESSKEYWVDLEHSLPIRQMLANIDRLAHSQFQCGSLYVESDQSNAFYLSCLVGYKYFLAQEGIQSRTLDEIIYGGTTNGLLSFFRNVSWNECGQRFDDDTDGNIIILTVLGVSFLDRAKGFGASWNLWQQIKFEGGYDEPVRIMGTTKVGAALNLLRCLITDYQAASSSFCYSDYERREAAEYAYLLQIDHDALLTELSANDEPWFAYLQEGVNPYRYDGAYTSVQIDGSIPEVCHE